MEEPKVIQITNLIPEQDGKFRNPQRGRIYDPVGIAPCIDNMGGGNQEPKIMQMEEPTILTPIRTEEQRQLRKQGIDTFGGRQMMPRKDGVSNTITTVQKDNLLQEPIKIRQATAQGYIEYPAGGGFDAAYPDSKLRRGRVQDNGNVIGAITASADSHCVYEGAEVSILGYTRDDKGNVTSRHEKEIAGTLHTSIGSGGNTDQFVKEASGIYDNQFGEFARGSIEGMARTLKADHHNAVLLRYRIRKLTPRECFRLMDMDDADIDKIEAHRIKVTLKNGTAKDKPIPKSAKYKLAGNSIVVSCLYHIFHQMFIAEPPEPKPIQKSLFDL
ncbi:MAG: DNA cytosine methyltransferase [Muribaculaceae bacterium]|nr:DNA cytosine methyltransferase [Muribaculaceae bacterium]